MVTNFLILLLVSELVVLERIKRHSMAPTNIENLALYPEKLLIAFLTFVFGKICKQVKTFKNSSQQWINENFEFFITVNKKELTYLMIKLPLGRSNREVLFSARRLYHIISMIPYHKFSFPISAWVISIFHLKIFFKSRKNENVLYISLRDNISR